MHREEVERERARKLKEKEVLDPLAHLDIETSENEPSLGIKQARILMNEHQATTVQELIADARENHWMEEVAKKQRE